MTFHLSRVGPHFAGAKPAGPQLLSKLRSRWFVSCLYHHSERVIAVTPLRLALAALAVLLATAVVVAAALAGSDVALQTISNPDGLTLMVPAAWHSGASASAVGSSLKTLVVSPDGKEMLRVSAIPQTIQTSDLGTFVGLLLGNVAGTSVSLGPSQSIDVSGAGGGVMQVLRYTDSSGARLAETVIAAATGTKLYVVDVVTPADYADENAGLLSSVTGSLQITGR
jgi:hypothetical protein